MNLERRTFLALGAALALRPHFASAQTSPAIRHDVATPPGLTMLGLYSEAVKRMRALPATDPRSWTFQWYIHAVPNNPGKARALSQIFGAGGSPARTLATEIWSSCEPHFSNRSDLFLPWHRYFLLAFEQVARELLGNPAFALPYWDYTRAGGRALPATFRDGAATQWEPLFQMNRKKTAQIDINAGDPMDKGTVASPYTLRAMERTQYSGQLGFCATLDQTLHGNVHTGVGDSSNMGSVSTAAGDPVFWLHHCNIDRIWAGWNKAGGRNPAFNRSFVFAGPGGARLAFDGSNVGDTAALGYAYDTLPALPQTTQVSAGVSAGESETIAESNAPITLGPARTDVSMRAAPGEPSLAAELDEDARIFVVLEGLNTDVEPGTLYEVFIDLPPAAGPDERRMHYIGTFGFFGAERGHQHGPGPSFEITDTVRAIAQAGNLRPESVITIEPVGTPSGDAEPSVARIEMVRR